MWLWILLCTGKIPPAGMNDLLPQMLEVLPTEASSLSDPCQDWSSKREPLPSTWTVFSNDQ